MGEERNHYVYLYFRLNGVPVYVGQGKGDRWKCHKKPSPKGKNLHLWNLIQSAKALGKPLPVVIFRSNLTVEESIELEALLIEWYGREARGGPLVNQTDRHGGTPGWKASGEWRDHRRTKALEMWADPEIRATLCAKKKGNQNNKDAPRTQKWCAAISKSLEGNQRTLGYKHREDSCEKMRLRWQDPEWRANEMHRRKNSGMYGAEAVARRAAKRITNNQAKKTASV